jgi:hypothetical protein
VHPYDGDENYDYFLSFSKQWSTGGMKLTGKTEELRENLSQCHFVHQKSHMD